MMPLFKCRASSASTFDLVQVAYFMKLADNDFEVLEIKGTGTHYEEATMTFGSNKTLSVLVSELATCIHQNCPDAHRVLGTLNTAIAYTGEVIEENYAVLDVVASTDEEETLALKPL